MRDVDSSMLQTVCARSRGVAARVPSVHPHGYRRAIPPYLCRCRGALGPDIHDGNSTEGTAVADANEFRVVQRDDLFVELMQKPIANMTDAEWRRLQTVSPFARMRRPR